MYKNTGSGWQQAGPSGWQSGTGDTSWADREQQARSQSDSRFGAFQQGGFANRFAGGGWDGGGFGGGSARFGGFRR